MSTISATNSTTVIAKSDQVLSLGSALSLLAFGAVIIFLVGFSPMDVAHNATHDSRHALAFPCH